MADSTQILAEQWTSRGHVVEVNIEQQIKVVAMFESSLIASATVRDHNALVDLGKRLAAGS